MLDEPKGREGRVSERGAVSRGINKADCNRGAWPSPPPWKDFEQGSIRGIEDDAMDGRGWRRPRGLAAS